MADRIARVLARLAAVGVAAYVGSWLVAGWLTPGYDPMSQAISELFAVGSPAGPRWLLTASLVMTGLMLVAFGPALDVLLPGTGRAAPVASVVSGMATVLVALLPCTAGCPGFGTTTVDSLHVLAAATGYVALIAVPLLVALRVRHHDRALAVVSVLFGVVAAVGFAIGSTTSTDFGGLVQRGYNTVADAWLVVAGPWLARRTPHSPAADRPQPHQA